MAIEDRGPELRAVGIGFLAFAYISMALRSYVRVFLVKAFGLDDWMMLLALICYTIHNIWMFMGIQSGTGRHFADLTPEGISGGLKNWYLDLMAYSATMMASKTSIAIFLLRITGTKRLHRWIIYIALGFSLITTLAFFFVCMLQCQPVSFFWTRTGDGKCFDLKVISALTYTFSTFSMVTDYIFALLPLQIIRGLNMSNRSKWLLVPLFLMGTVASSAVAVRFAYVKTFSDPDFLWATLDIAIWSNVEMGLAIAAGSLATLRPLVRICLARFGLSSAAQYKNNYNPHSGSAPTRIIKPNLKPRTVLDDDLDADLYNMQPVPTNSRTAHAWADPQDPEAQSSKDCKVTTETRITITSAEPGPSWKAAPSEGDNESEEGGKSSHEYPAEPTSFLHD